MIDSVSNGAADLKRSKRVRRPQAAGTLDKLPPHSIENEQGVLGCCLIDSSCVDECNQRLKNRSDAFYDLRHQSIFEALAAMRRGGNSIDVITLQQHLKDDGLLEQCGGITYLSSLADLVPSTERLGRYLEIVSEKYRLRKIVNTCTNIVSRVYDYEGDVDELVNTVQRDMEKVFESESHGRFYTPDDLDAFDVTDDKTSLIGNRWLCKRGKLLVPAASGAGKSSLAMQMLMLFAIGRDFYGVKPVRPLSSIIIGDENDQGDMAEMFQGTRNYLKINSFEDDDVYALLRKNMKIWDCPSLTGEAFLSAVEQELIRNPRDIACLDPLVSFAGCDLTKQDAAAKFLRGGLSRISAKTGVIWFVVHHTPKPVQSSGKAFAKKISDHQYSGAGTFDLPGWARAVMTLEESTDGIYRLVFSKRGGRAGATHPNGEPTKMLWMRHATEGIHWEQIDPPIEEAESREPKEKALTKPEQIATLNLGTFLSKCPKEGESLRGMIRRLKTWLASKECPKRSLAQASHGSLNTAVGLMLENEKIELKDDTYFKGAQA